MPFEIIRGDIAALPIHVDAIVNTANPEPIVGDGTDWAIHQAAGPQLLAARKEIGCIELGTSDITPAFNLNAKFVIHTVGPCWIDGRLSEEMLLRRTYENALSLAWNHKCDSVAFPLLSAGCYGFPEDIALSVANEAIGDFLLHHDLTVYLVVFGADSFHLSRQLQRDIQCFIDDYYVETAKIKEYTTPFSSRGSRAERRYLAVEAPCCASTSTPAKSFEDLFSVGSGLDDLLNSKCETFSETVIRIIDANGWTDSMIYKRAGMDRRLFNKIINDKNYHPSKNNALLLAVALHLNLNETKDLIAKAGYTLTETSSFDIIVAYFICNRRYNYMEINEALYSYGLEQISKGYGTVAP